ncbi:MAG: 4Fe-4S cluster-binding domain-containing protein [Clostridium lundense]|nr:4Fe-4S cluster-binding domain-containing protein [Clostridium lundense]
MVIKGIIDEDFVNYKKVCMTIEMPYCSFKCDKECGMQVCQNSALATANNVEVEINNLVNRYINNDISKAVCFQGLEPMDSYNDLIMFISAFREQCDDDIVIYTGYKYDEIKENIDYIAKRYKNIIVKFGRFIPNQESHYDKTLEVTLASPNQYAEKFS